MSGRSLLRVAMIALAVSSATIAQADETAVRKEDVPAAARNAVSAKFPNEKQTRFARTTDKAGKPLYAIVVTTIDGNVEVGVTPEGVIMTEETSVTTRDLPTSVRNGLAQSKYAAAKVKKAKRIESSHPAAVRYDVLIEHDGKLHELTFESSGAITRDQPMNKDPATKK